MMASTNNYNDNMVIDKPSADMVEDAEALLRSSMLEQQQPMGYPVAVTKKPEPKESPEIQQQSDTIIKSLQREINILGEPTSDRVSKRRALERIQRETVSKPGMHPRLATALFKDLVKPLLKCFADPFEKCRELSIQTVSLFTAAVNDLIPSLPYTLPVLSLRLSQPEIVEPAEELRLLLLTTLAGLIDKSKIAFSPGVDETVKILGRTLQDPFADVRKESSKIVSLLCKHCPRVVSLHGAVLAKALVTSLQHRHSAVRIAALKALEDAIIADASGLDDVSDSLRALTMDKSPTVREQLYTTVANWLTNMTDRYSLGYKLLPVMFAGLTDEVTSLRQFTISRIDGIGALYEAEWESRVKDEMDYLMGVGNVNLDPDRPRVGSRHLARDNTQKVVNKLVEGMQDWNPDVRAKSAAVLGSFIFYTEDNVTGYIGVILPVLYQILSGDESHVLANTLRLAEVVGRFVNPDLYIDILLSHAGSGNGSTTAHKIGCLRTLHRLVTGSSTNVMTRRQVETIARALSEKEMAGNENMGLVAEVAATALAATVQLSQIDVDESAAAGDEGFLVFVVLMTLSTHEGSDKVPGWTEISRDTSAALKLLPKCYNAEAEGDLYPMHFDKMLSSLALTVETWGRFSIEPRVLRALLIKAGSLVGERVQSILTIMALAVSEARDIEVRASVLQILLDILRSPTQPLNSAQALHEFVPVLVDQIIIPSATWKPGRRLSMIRGLAMRIFECLLTIAQGSERIGYALKQEVERWLVENKHRCLPVIVGCLEDDDLGLRLTSLRVFVSLFDGLATCQAKMLAYIFKLTYPELVKRLDDASDDARVLACMAITSLTKAISVWHEQNSNHGDSSGYIDSDGQYIETRLDNVHWEAMIKGVMIHTDDSNSKIQEASLSTLAHIVRIAPKAVIEEILPILGQYRCEQRLREIFTAQ